MAISSLFNVKVTLYFKALDSDLYGGAGSVGYSMQAWDHCKSPENCDENFAELCRADMAKMLHIPVEQLSIITFEEYEEAVGEDVEVDDDEEDF